MKSDKGKKYFSEKEDNFLKELYSNFPNKLLAEKLNRSVFSIENRAYKLGLKKSKSYLASMTSKPDIFGKEVIYVTQTFEIYPSKINFE